MTANVTTPTKKLVEHSRSLFLPRIIQFDCFLSSSTIPLYLSFTVDFVIYFSQNNERNVNKNVEALRSPLQYEKKTQKRDKNDVHKTLWFWGWCDVLIAKIQVEQCRKRTRQAVSLWTQIRQIIKNWLHPG
jgi:hypothetical protein